MLTKPQKKVLDYLNAFIGKQGYAPSNHEIRKHLKVSSPSTVHHHLKSLEDLGYIRKVPNQPRAIEIHEKEQMVRVPLLGTIAAGEPIEAVEEKETIAIPKSKFPRSAEIYALRVVGNSMIDENINDGDIILVRQQETAKNGQKVVALIDNHEATLKKFYKERGHIRLQPANKNMKPLIFRNGRDISIQGIVLNVIRDINMANTEFRPEWMQISKRTLKPR